MKLQAIQNTFRFRRLKGLIKRGWRMDVEIVQHQYDLIRFRKDIIDQVLHTMSKVYLGPLVGHFDLTPARQRLKEDEEIERI